MHWTKITSAFAVLGLAAVGLAQTYEVTALRGGPGDGAPFVMSTSGGMFGQYRPDFERGDLPTMHDILELDDVQQFDVHARLEAYLEAFAEIRKEHLGDQAEQVMWGPNGEAIQVNMSDAPIAIEMGDSAIAFDNATIDLSDIIEQAEGGEGGERRIAIAVTSDVMVDGSGAEPEITVAVGGEGDFEIPEELIEQLREEAMRMAEEIEANGGLIGAMDEEELADMMAEHDAQMEERAEAEAAFRRARRALRASFVQQVHEQLNPGQQARWELVEQVLTRRKTLPMGQFDGERTDLIGLLDELELVENVDASTLTEYASTLHQALLDRNAFLETSLVRTNAAMREQDVDKAIDIAERESQLRKAVRTINLQYTDLLAEQFEETDQASFRDAALRRHHPRIYRPSRGERTFEAALAMEDLEPDLVEALTALQTAYDRELAELTEQLRATVLKHEPDQRTHGLELMREVMEGEGEPGGMVLFERHDEDPIHQGFNQRRELDRKYIDQVRELVGEERAAQLPKPPAQRRVMFFGGDDN